MGKRIIETDFWNDDLVVDQFSVEDKYFMMYLMTNPRGTAIGIYKLPMKIISFETGYTKEVVRTLLERFNDQYKRISYDFDGQEVAVLNTLKYTISKGGKPIEDMVERELREVENDQLIADVYDNMSDWWKKSRRKIDETIALLFYDELKKRKEAKEKKLNTNANTNAYANANANTDSTHDTWDDTYYDTSTYRQFNQNQDNEKTKDLPEVPMVKWK